MSLSVFLGKEHYLLHINTKIGAGAVFPVLTRLDPLNKK